MSVDVRVEVEELGSLERAIRSLKADRRVLKTYGLSSPELSVAIDDLELLAGRVRHAYTLQAGLFPELADTQDHSKAHELRVVR